MKRVLLLAVGGIVLVVAAGLIAVGGYGSKLLGGEEHPPCETLPTPGQVRRALDHHAELTDMLTGAGKGVRVAVGTPCDDEQAALVEVQVSSDDEQARVDDLLGNSRGFGVPVMVVHE